MDYRKLFHVLVVGGALVGGASGCGDGSKETPPPKSSEGSGDAGLPDGGTTSHEQDAGSTDDQDPGGGVEGW